MSRAACCTDGATTWRSPESDRLSNPRNAGVERHVRVMGRNGKPINSGHSRQPHSRTKHNSSSASQRTPSCARDEDRCLAIGGATASATSDRSKRELMVSLHSRKSSGAQLWNWLAGAAVLVHDAGVGQRILRNSFARRGACAARQVSGFTAAPQTSTRASSFSGG